MLSYTICGSCAVITSQGAAFIGDSCIEVAPDPGEAGIRLYRTDDRSFAESVFSHGKAVFDDGFIAGGGEYLPRIITTDGREIDGLPFAVFEKNGKLYAVKKHNALPHELNMLWRAVIELRDGAERSAATAAESAEKVKALIDGYRTE